MSSLRQIHCCSLPRLIRRQISVQADTLIVSSRPPSPVPVVFSSLVLALELLGALLRQASQ